MKGREALERFLRSLEARGTSAHTRRAYRTAIEQYLGWLEERPGADWRRPGRSELRGYLAHLAGRPLARSSVGSRLAAIRSFYRYARREGWVEGDPWAAVGTPRRGHRLPRVLQVDDVERLLDTVEVSAGRRGPGAATGKAAAALVLRDRAIVELAYAGGLRVSELAEATLSELDLARAELRVVGKGSRNASLCWAPRRAMRFRRTSPRAGPYWPSAAGGRTAARSS